MRRQLVALVALVALSSCSLAPTYVRPDSPVPPSWPVGDAYLATHEAELPSVTYREIFRDPRLQSLVEQALANNRDLRVAAAHIVAARAQYGIQRAELFPAIDATAGARRTYQGNAPAGQRNTNAFAADVGITAWEIDVFGRIRSLTDAAQSRYFEQEATARATRLTLIGDIATAWLTYAGDKSLLRIARDTVESAGASVALTRQRFEGGVSPQTDIDQASQVLLTARSDLAQLVTQLAQDVNALQLLVGAPIDATRLPDAIEDVTSTVAELPAGLDSTILLRRPDVVQAEFELRATNAEIGAARAELFPRIDLTSALGFASGALSSLFTRDAFVGSIGSTASYPIFRAGAGREKVRYSDAQRDAALANYEKTIQTAFKEVADALARRGTIDAQLRAQQDLVAASLNNYRLSDQRYRGGVVTFLASLDAQRSYYSAQRTLVATQLVKATNLVTLYRTLGGDAMVDANVSGARESGSWIEVGVPR